MTNKTNVFFIVLTAIFILIFFSGWVAVATKKDSSNKPVVETIKPNTSTPDPSASNQTTPTIVEPAPASPEPAQSPAPVQTTNTNNTNRNRTRIENDD